MAGYTRVDTSNNIADGNVISAADLDNEFDGVQAGFNASTGHTHGGAAGEGAPITKLGPVQDVTISTSLMAPKTTNTVDLGSSSLRYKDLFLAGNATIAGTLGVTGAATLGAGAILNTPASVTLTNATGLPISTGVSGLGTGVATALAVNVGSAGAPVLFNGALGTPSSGTVTNLTGTASININGTVGATTASTGNFTTLTTSSTVTHNGGTANGVAYLNGSKVLTTGSALTFDGANLAVNRTAITGGDGNVTAGVFAARTALNAHQTGASILQYTGSIGALRVYGETGVVGALAFSLGAGGSSDSEQMRLTSTGLGIGTSSPDNKLTIGSGSINIFSGQSTADAFRFVGTQFDAGNTNNAAQIRFAIDGFDTFTRIAFATSAGPGTLSEKMRLDSSGNLGLGVTPSAWGSSIKAIQMGFAGSTAISGRTDAFQSNFTQNAYDTGSNSWVYLQSTNANRYSMVSGQHQWFTAPSGTAGNAISFTQAMTLDASGNLLVGTTSNSNSYRMRVLATGTAGAIFQGAEYVQVVVTDGTRSMYQQVYNNAAVLGTATSTPLIFTIADTERARIDSSGNLLVGTSARRIDEKMVVVFNGTTGSGLNLDDSATTGTSTAQRYYRNAVQVGSITTTTVATLYNTTSDQRLKENIVDAPEFGTVIDSLQVRSFDWKTDQTHQRAGFVAQELVTVAPEAVHQPTNPDDMMAVDYSKLVPMLVKEIQSLRQRLAAAGI